jgi:hypothetical protein
MENTLTKGAGNMPGKYSDIIFEKVAIDELKEDNPNWF